MKKVFSTLLICIMMLATIPYAQANEYMYVWAPDGRSERIRTADFDVWHAVGWYSAPVMYVYAPDGRCELILQKDYNEWNNVGWYSAPVMYVYAPDGRKELIFESDAPAWKAVGWDYQTGYADNIPWTSDDQYWAVINLNYGPYSDWHQNRIYYINKYFIEMPEYNRNDIKHYFQSDIEYGSNYLVIPRYKTTNTITSLNLNYKSDHSYTNEYSQFAQIANGTPFSVTWEWPLEDEYPMFRVKTYSNGLKSFDIVDNFSRLPWLILQKSCILDLTEWHHSTLYRYY